LLPRGDAGAYALRRACMWARVCPAGLILLLLCCPVLSCNKLSQVPAGMPSQRVMLLVLLAAAAADAFLVSGGGCRGLVVCFAARVGFDVKTQAETKCCQHMHVLTYMLA